MTEHTTPQTTDPNPDASQESRHIWYKDRILLLIVPTALALDQLTKYIVKTNLRLGESWPSEGFFRFTYGLNSGTAFGFLPNQTTLLIVASIIAIGFLAYFYRAHALPSPLLRVAIGLQLGGAFGNLIDRVTAGAVVDFIDVGWWPIFNIADSSIVVGMALLVYVVLFNDTTARPTKEAEPDISGGDN